MHRFGVVVLLATAAATGVAATSASPTRAWGAPQRWTKLVTTAGFSVDQPADWTPMSGPADRVGLVNFPCHSAGAALCDGQAEGTVRSEPGAPKATRTQACWNLAETVSEAQVGPGRRLQTTELSCSIGARRFTIVER